MQEQNNLLTIIFCCNEKLDRESTLFRKLMSAKLKYDEQFDVLPVYGHINLLKVGEIVSSIKSKYIIFIDEKHDVSSNFVKVFIDFLATRTVYLAEPYVYFGDIPAKLDSTALDNRYFYSRDTDIYGVAFNRKRLLDVLDAITDIDKSAIYLSYRLYWSLAKTKPLQAGYTIANNVKAVNGSMLDPGTLRLVPLLASGSPELRVYILRFLTVYLRGLRSSTETLIPTRHVIDVVQKYNLARLTSLLGPMQQFEAAWIEWLNSPTQPNVLYKQLTDSDAYLRFALENKRPTNNFVYCIKSADQYLTIRRIYLPHDERSDFDDASVYDFYSRPVSKESTILFYDRPLQADDNAEYLYEYIMHNYPEFENCYFGLNPKSNDWARLQRKGFKLVPFFSKEFYEIFLESDVVVSSQIYNLSYKGKTLKNSRSIYLQHGVQLNDMSDWINSKQFDIFVATGKPEEEYIKRSAPVETLNSGLPRLESLQRRVASKRNILFMPTWRFNLNTVSDQQFIESDYYNAINQIMTDHKISEYLVANDINLQVKLHPNISSRTQLFNFSERVINCEKSYREAISTAEFALTDFSSVVLDAAFIDIPISYYQWDAATFFHEQPYENRLDYNTDGLGPVFYESSEIIDYISSGSYLRTDKIYSERKRHFFEGVDKGKINETIVKKMLEL
ncbi:CDP-glycerol glycerophosphotransferase family protein [Glutamicibacter halophytocola]|uniref:CDP-glycerol glycerophosphotransferase family protein n=1 Tax=Glutamicibacter halophytocola TaxID=1933880 RepID=A0AA95BVI4_9MICC|nr:CDP-glycerol glycerophosphotransferase family protein [Glutamicibacter halophytocola]UUX60388.1 CDP-glycerol glycerophosphotransferase family protein [Glutamicibacter halophytocola]